MKRLVVLILFAATLAACKKSQTMTLPVPGNKITGKWTINSVTVIPRDSTGKAINNGAVYPEPSYYYFQFNSDNTWAESLSPDPNSGIGEAGNYILHADTSFTLINVNLPSSPVECKITSLTDKSFVFTHQKATLFNGITPGYLEYIFDLKK
ncbi:hypothetical protein [Mucilaginibacter sp. UR6-11]|uniref:hypothetical protein n=1 Tax=Mucilaginibacter sp. UR6-11 TaxID=1435644 RepID=UPI001E4535C4|nr:hypothetical protein [Mucilaginibacter sp. UR6-11]MCC8426180.1 hypothetical protein [Mucilaginibacter sp. UR6-11]